MRAPHQKIVQSKAYQYNREPAATMARRLRDAVALNARELPRRTLAVLTDTSCDEREAQPQPLAV